MFHRSLHAPDARLRVWLAAAVLLSAAGLPAAADDAPAAEAESTGQLQEIVVTSTRREENLSRVPISVTALTQEDMDNKGIKDIIDVVRFTPGIAIDNSGTNNISIRGISSTGGAGTTGIYIDDTPIQMRALAFSPDDALPKSFDIDRVEVLRGPQGTLFGAGSEGGTVRYITTPPSLTKTSVYARSEIAYTQGGDPSYEAGVAAGGPIIEGTLGARATVWYRRDGGWIDRVDPTAADPQSAVVDHNANRADTLLVRLAGVWAPNSVWTVTPSIFYQNRQVHDVSVYWPIYSDPGSDRYVSGDPTARPIPDKFYLPALKIEANFDSVRLVSNTSYYHREETSGYDGTLYNLGFYQSEVFPEPYPTGASFPLLDGTGLHLPTGLANYRSPASVDNGQENITEEIRLLSNDANARLVWTTGLFFSSNRQSYLEQIHDPMLNALSLALTGAPYTDTFVDADGNPVPYVAGFPNDSYFLQTHAKDQQEAWFGEATFGLVGGLKLIAGLRYSKMEYSFVTRTGGPQLFAAPSGNSGDKKENSVTPKLGLSWQVDPNNLYYATYAKGFRPGGANNPVPYAACAQDFVNFGIPGAPSTYNSDTVDSYEIGAKNNFQNRIRIASSIYYIRWHNIQQTVIPPICQISFIANLGQAVAKGADIQIEMALNDAWSAELSGGYTDARYTQDSKLSPTSGSPVVGDGDAIAGQSTEAGGGKPAAPYTVSAGIQYRFNAFSHESFVRADDEFEARSHWLPPSQDPNTLQYDAANFTLASTNFLSLRAGMSFGEMSIEGFIDNLTDTHALTDYNFSIDPGTGDSRLMRAYTVRPRTFGLTFIYRK
ncbi:MAG TPA: TonB-dependent receptor [Steroidobacteraceae bacterium]|jgi:outer membrane receptor protein involved in Fe transport